MVKAGSKYLVQLPKRHSGSGASRRGRSPSLSNTPDVLLTWPSECLLLQYPPDRAVGSGAPAVHTARLPHPASASHPTVSARPPQGTTTTTPAGATMWVCCPT